MASNPGECYKKEQILNGIFYSSVILEQSLLLPIGKATDKFGPRLVCMFGCFFFAVGILTLAASELSLGLAHHIGYYIIALSAPCLFGPSLQLCRVFPKVSSVLMAFMSSAFDASAIVFRVIECFIPYVPEDHDNPIKTLLYAYSVIPIVAFFLVTSFFPDQSIPYPSPRPRGVPWKRVERKTPEEEKPPNRTLSSIMKSPEFWLVAIFNAFMAKKFNIFIATLPMQLGRHGLAWEFQRQVLLDFTTLFAICGVLSMNSAALLLDSFSMSFNFLLLWLFFMGWGPLMEMGTPVAVSAGVLFACLMRPYYYVVLNHYCERLFGNALLGEVNSWLIFFSGISHIYSYAFIYHSWMDGGLIYLAMVRLSHKATILGVILPIYLFYRRL